MNTSDASHPNKKPDLLLVIDDDDGTSYMLKIYFRAQGYEVVTAKSTDGKADLENALNLKPDLVLLDPLKPGIDGFEVLAEIEKEIRTQTIPLIIVTQKDERSDSMNDLAWVGAEDYVTKPFDIEELKLRVKSGIRRK